MFFFSVILMDMCCGSALLVFEALEAEDKFRLCEFLVVFQHRQGPFAVAHLDWSRAAGPLNGSSRLVTTKRDVLPETTSGRNSTGIGWGASTRKLLCHRLLP